MKLSKLACGVLLAGCIAGPAYAIDIIEEWGKVQVSARMLANGAGGTGPNTTLTRSDMITFQ